METMNTKPKILLVDDKIENLVALEKILADLDVEFVRATSGNEALKKTLEEGFAIALVDVQMPEMDGYELAQYLRAGEKTRHLPIIFISAVYSDEYYVFKGYDAGAVDYIVKPVNPKILLSKVDVFLQLENNLRELKASEERFKSLVLTIPDIVYRIDRKGFFIFVNDAVKKLGHEPAELVGKHFSEIILPAEVESVSRAIILPKYADKTTGDKNAPKLFDERRAGERKTTDLEIKLVLKDRKELKPGLLLTMGEDVVIVEVNSSGMWEINPYAKKKELIGTVGVIRDITQRKLLEKNLEKYCFQDFVKNVFLF